MAWFKPPEYASQQQRQVCPRCNRKALYHGGGRWRCQACFSVFTERGTFVVQDGSRDFNDYHVVQAAVEQELRDDLAAANDWWNRLNAEQRVHRFREAVRLQAWEAPGDRGFGAAQHG